MTRRILSSRTKLRWILRLTQNARLDREDFERGDHNDEGISLADRGCICFTGCAPCSYCTHPGNPRNQEDDSCLEKVQVPEDYEDDYDIIEIC